MRVGGLKAVFMVSYLHMMIISTVLITIVTIVYIKVYMSNMVRTKLAVITLSFLPSLLLIQLPFDPSLSCQTPDL